MLNKNKLIFFVLLLSVAISTQLLKYAENLLGKGTFGESLLAYPLSLAVSIIISGILLMSIILIIKLSKVHDQSN